ALRVREKRRLSREYGAPPWADMQRRLDHRRALNRVSGNSENTIRRDAQETREHSVGIAEWGGRRRCCPHALCPRVLTMATGPRTSVTHRRGSNHSAVDAHRKSRTYLPRNTFFRCHNRLHRAEIGRRFSDPALSRHLPGTIPLLLKHVRAQ